jgi:hypothetical protein
MILKRIVQQDSKILTQIEQSFQYKTGRRKGKQKGVDETHLWPKILADISILSKIVAYASNPPWAASMMLWNVDPPEVGPPEVAPTNVVPPEAAPTKVGPTEVDTPEVCPTEVGPPEVAPTKVGPLEVGTPEVVPSETEGSIFLAK